MCLITSPYVRKRASYAVRRFANSIQKASDIAKGILGRTSSSQPSQTVVRQGPRSDMFINSAKGKMLKDKYIESIYESKPIPIRPELYKKSPRGPLISPVGGSGAPVASLERLEASALKKRMDEIAKMNAGDKTVKTQEYYDKLFSEIDQSPYVGGIEYYNPRTGAHIRVPQQGHAELIKVSKHNSQGGYDEMETLYDWGELGLFKAKRHTKEFDGAVYNHSNNSNLFKYDTETGKFTWAPLCIRTKAVDIARAKNRDAEYFRKSGKLKDAEVYRNLADSINSYF